MRPDQRWFPTNMVERAAWMANYTPVFVEFGPSLGFSPAEIDQAVADNEMVQYLADAISRLSNYERAVRSFQRTLLLGRRGEVTPEFPALASVPVPPIPPTGIFERLERNVRRVRVQRGYSASLGERMGIIPRKAQRADLSTFVPKLKAKASPTAYTFDIRVPMREFDMCVIEYKRQGSAKWEVALHSTIGKAAVTIAPTTAGQPEMIDVRVRMCEGNYPVGNYSNIQTIVLTP
jgi:hypothetical protein